MALKKGSFRMLHRDWWRLCRVRKIRRDTLLVLLALEAGPWGAGQYTGLFRISIEDITSYTGLQEKEVGQAIDSLERLGAIVYDKKYQVLYVTGMLERQSPSFASSENNLQGIANHVERMPGGSRAVQEFIKAQSNIPKLFELLEGYLEGESEGESPGESEGESAQTLDLKTLIPEDKETVIKDKGNGKGEGAGKGTFLETVRKGIPAKKGPPT